MKKTEIKIVDGREIEPFNILPTVSISATKEKKGRDTLVKVTIHQPGRNDSFFMMPGWHNTEAVRKTWRENAYFKEMGEIVGEIPEGEEKQIRQALRQISITAEELTPASEEAEEEARYILSDEEKKEAMKLLNDPLLLYRVLITLDRAIAGEAATKLNLYLIGISRKTYQGDMHGFVSGDSAAGKTYTVLNTLKLFPKENVLVITRASGTAFDHLEDIDLSQVILFVCEGEGLKAAIESLKGMTDGETGAPKTLITEKDSLGRLRTILKNAKGEPILLTTSAKILDDFEFLNRLLILGVDLSPEQTERVMEKIAEKESTPWRYEGGGEEHIQFHNLFRVLPDETHVFIPFAATMRPLFNKGKIRTRRDYKKFLGLIKNSATLFQFQRNKRREDGVEYVEANFQDFYNAFVISESTMRRTVSGLEEASQVFLDRLCEHEESIFNEDPKHTDKNTDLPVGTDQYHLRDVLIKKGVRYSNSRIYELLKKLIEEGYLGKGKIGRKNHYWLVTEMEDLTFELSKWLREMLIGSKGDKNLSFELFPDVRGGDIPPTEIKVLNPIRGVIDSWVLDGEEYHLKELEGLDGVYTPSMHPKKDRKLS